MSIAAHTLELRMKATRARNPFRTAVRRKQFEAMVNDYIVGNPALFHKGGTENHGNNIGGAFWRAFHGQPCHWIAKHMPLYVAYAAGIAVAKATGSAS